MKRKEVFVLALGTLIGLVAVGTTAGVAGLGAKQSIPNPDAGLTDAQRNQAYEGNWQQFQTDYDRWSASLDISKIALRNLRHGQLNAASAKPEPTLARAVRAADVIVTGTVTTIRPAGLALTDVTLSVEAVHKGHPTPALVIRQAGGLFPEADWHGVYIVDSANAPLMLPGDRVLLFLTAGSASAPQYGVESFTGIYQIRSGVVSTVPGNPFGSGLRGLSESSFRDAIASEARSATG